MVIRDYFSIRIGKVPTRDAARVRYKNTCGAVSSCLQIFFSGFRLVDFGRPCPSSQLSQCLSLLLSRQGSRPSRRRFPLLVSLSQSQIEETSKRCDNVVLCAHISAMIKFPISYVLCLSPAVPVVHPLPTNLSFEWFLVAKAAIMKLLGVGLGLGSYTGLPEAVAWLT